MSRYRRCWRRWSSSGSLLLAPEPGPVRHQPPLAPVPLVARLAGLLLAPAPEPVQRQLVPAPGSLVARLVMPGLLPVLAPLPPRLRLGGRSVGPATASTTRRRSLRGAFAGRSIAGCSAASASRRRSLRGAFTGRSIAGCSTAATAVTASRRGPLRGAFAGRNCGNLAAYSVRDRKRAEVRGSCGEAKKQHGKRQNRRSTRPRREGGSISPGGLENSRIWPQFSWNPDPPGFDKIRKRHLCVPLPRFVRCLVLCCP
jgi:hypothetical protein